MAKNWKLVTAEEATQHPLYGVGGWLALFTFSLLAGFLGDFGAINAEALKIGMSFSKFLSFNLPSILFIKIALAIGLLKVVVIYTLLFLKHPSFRPVSTYILVGYLPALVLVGVFTPFSGLGESLVLTFGSWLISCAVWVTYLQRSKRVRVTFEHTVKVAQKKVADIGKITPHREAKDALADASLIDATYEKIDQELKADNLDRATWTRAQGDADGNAERAKSLYIKYRAQRLLAAGLDESAPQSTVNASSIEKRARRYIFDFIAQNAGFVVLLVVAVVIVIGFYIKQDDAPTKGATSVGNVFDQFDTAKPAQADKTPGKSVDWSQFTPVQPPTKPDSLGSDPLASEVKEAGELGISIQEYGRRKAKSASICRTAPTWVDLECSIAVMEGRR